MVSFQHRVRIPGDVLVQTVDGEAVLLHLGRASYFGLDATATRMWQALTAAESIEAAFHTLSEEYDVDPRRLRGDLAGLVEQLLAGGLLELDGE